MVFVVISLFRGINVFFIIVIVPVSMPVTMAVAMRMIMEQDQTQDVRYQPSAPDNAD